jgi:hypothetical protein
VAVEAARRAVAPGTDAVEDVRVPPPLGVRHVGFVEPERLGEVRRLEGLARERPAEAVEEVHPRLRAVGVRRLGVGIAAGSDGFPFDDRLQRRVRRGVVVDRLAADADPGHAVVFVVDGDVDGRPGVLAAELAELALSGEQPERVREFAAERPGQLGVARERFEALPDGVRAVVGHRNSPPDQSNSLKSTDGASRRPSARSSSVSRL